MHIKCITKYTCEVSLTCDVLVKCSCECTHEVCTHVRTYVAILLEGNGHIRMPKLRVKVDFLQNIQ